MNLKRNICKGIICMFVLVLGIISFNIYHSVKANDTYGKITLTKTAEPIGNRMARVTLGIHPSTLRQTITDIVIVMDRSGSMAETICVSYYANGSCKERDYRLNVEKNQAISFIENILPANNSGNVKVGIVAFGTRYEEIYSTKTYNDMTSSQTVAKNMIRNIQLTSDNGTNMQAGLNAAKKLFESSDRINAQNKSNKIIILISDGEPTRFTLANGTLCGSGQGDSLGWNPSNACEDSKLLPSSAAKAEADELKADGVEIYAVGFAGANGNLHDFLTEKIASQPEETYSFDARTTEKLEEVMTQISANIKHILATNAVVTDKIPASFELTADAKKLLKEQYGNDIIIRENSDGTTTISVNYKEISSIQGAYTIQYDVEAKDGYSGAMYTNSEAIFEATASSDNTFYDRPKLDDNGNEIIGEDGDVVIDKSIEIEFDKPVTPIAPVTHDDDLTNISMYEDRTYTIPKSMIIENDTQNEEISKMIIHGKPELPDSIVSNKIVIDSVSCGRATLNEAGDIVYTPSEGCVGNPTIDYHIESTIKISYYDGNDIKENIYNLESVAAKVNGNTVTYTESSTIKLNVDKIPVTYSVKYLEQTTNRELIETKTVVNQYKNGDTVTEHALTGYETNINGVEVLKQYEIVGNNSQTITLKKDNNVIIFYYIKKTIKTDEPELEKISTVDKITSLKNPINYKITYYTEVEDFKGELTVTLIDSLPHRIVENESTFHCSNTNSYKCTSTYDRVKETITYVIKYNIDTFETGRKYIIDFNLDINLKYDETDFDGSETSIINRVSTHLSADELRIDNSSDEEIPSDIKGTVEAKYVYLDSNNQEISITNGRYDYSETFKVGTSYKTTKKVIPGYTFKEVRGTENGIIKEGTITVTYIYTKDPVEVTEEPTIIKKVPSGTILNKTNQEITYTIDYMTTVKNHDGDVKLKVIDTLEYPIENVIVKTSGWSASYDGDKTIVFTKNYHIHTSITENNEVEIEEVLNYTVKYKTFNAEDDTDNLLTNKAKGVITILDIDTTGEETKEDVPIDVRGNVLVHYKEKDTNKELKTSELQVRNVKVGTTYQTNSATIGGYEVDSNSGNTTGIVKEKLTEVTYYYVRKAATPDNPVLTKTGTTSITRVDELVNYNMTYEAEISGYTGNLVITMIDKLPYKIDLSKSTISGNYIYDENAKTITWIILNEEDILPEQVIPINFEVNASLSYIGIDATDDEFTNTVEIHIQDGVHGENVQTEEHKTLIDVFGNVIVKHVDERTNNEISEVSPVSMSGKVGSNYVTNSATINGYELVTSRMPTNKEGTYIDGDIYVTYYYQKKDIKVTDASIDKFSSTEKILSLKQNVDYEINYNAYVEYRGNLIVTIIDKLPYPIDESMSELSGGIYNEEDLTITWTEKINNLNTYLTGHKHHISIQKFINLRYKELPSNDDVINEVTAFIRTEEGNTDNITPDNVIIPTEIKGNLYVEYIYIADDGEIKKLDSYSKVDYVGNTYVTENKKFNGYTLDKIPENAKGKITEELTRVTYFYTKTPVEIKENVVEKTSDDVVKNIKDVFNYNISYKTTIDEYIGTAKVLIVDQLNYPIDTTLSKLANGIYDKDKLTITWIKEYDVNTYENINNKINISIDISLYYINLDAKLDKVTNNVSTKLYVDNINKPVESKDSSETKLEISGRVVSKYVDQFGNKLLEPVITEGLVGEKYQTSSQNIEGYKLNKINGIETGEYIDGEIEVIYIYQKEESNIILPPQTNAKSYIYISVIITLLGLLISIKKIIKL